MCVGSDFTAGEVTVAFGDGVLEVSPLPINTIEDSVAEVQESFVVVVLAPDATGNCALLVNIRDNDCRFLAWVGFPSRVEITCLFPSPQLWTFSSVYRWSPLL